MSNEMKEKAELEVAKVHAAFNRLEEEARTIIESLAFRLKQALHATSHEAVDAQAIAASDKLASALNAARTSATGDEAVTPVEADSLSAAGSAAPVEAKPSDEAGVSTIREDVAALKEEFAKADAAQAEQAAKDAKPSEGDA